MKSFLPLTALAWGVLGQNGTAPSSNNTLAPSYVECPSRESWIRPASSGLSPEEKDWVTARKQVILPALGEYLHRALGTAAHKEDDEDDLERRSDSSDDPVAEYLAKLAENPDGIPTIGFSVSGGGWASSITGSGALRALDDRLPAAVEAGTGGLLQSLTYISGLSGGSWPTISLGALNNPTIDDMLAQWHTDISRVEGVQNDTDYAATADTMFGQIVNKAMAGFNVSVADFLGQAFAWEAVPGTQGGLNQTLSGFVNLSAFSAHGTPFPILQSAGLDADDPEYFGLQAPRYDTVIWEWNPYEFGTFEGPSGAFVPMEYLGTTFTDGEPANASMCVRGFDSLAMVLGAAGNAFNFWYIQGASNNTAGGFSKRATIPMGRRRRRQSPHHHHQPDDTPGIVIPPGLRGPPLSLKGYLKRLGRGLFRSSTSSSLRKRTPQFNNGFITQVVQAFGQGFNLSLPQFSYTSVPNPFRGTNYTQTTLWAPDALAMVDGSETLNAIPINVLARPERELDLIIAWDDAQDTPLQWMNGTSLYTAYRQSLVANIPFPLIPQPETFVLRGYNARPVFFGCNPKLTTVPEKGDESPIVLYLANAPYSAYSNYSGYQSALSMQQTDEVMVNSFDLVTQGNGTLAEDWPACLACAVVERSLTRLGLERGKRCDACLAEWCWDGEEEEGPVTMVDLPLALNKSLTFEEWNKTHPF